MSAAGAAAATARRAFRELHGVVVSAGLMQKTVKVRVGGQKWNKRVQKFFANPRTYLVHDPNSSLRTGDVVAIQPGWRTSKMKRHVVTRLIAPYGSSGAPSASAASGTTRAEGTEAATSAPEERPPIPTEEERIAARLAKREAKLKRRAERKKAAEEAGVDVAKSESGQSDSKEGKQRRMSTTGPQETSLSDVD